MAAEKALARASNIHKSTVFCRFQGDRLAAARLSRLASAFAAAQRDFQRLLREQPQIQQRVLQALAIRLAPETL
jgi:hypothetical protein